MPVLLPEHRDYLRDLTDSTLAAAPGLESVEPSDWLKTGGVESAIRIHYLPLQNCDPFYRDKLLPAFVDGTGKRIKYFQERGTSCRLFVPEPSVDRLQDYREPVIFIEGEFKTLYGYQAGIRCPIGVGGVWSFLDRGNGELIPELDRIAFRNREIFYIPDSDVWARQDLQQAIFEFGSKIRERGGLMFYFIQLPPLANGEKCGLDDFLKTESLDSLWKLPKVTLGGRGWEHQRKIYKVREAKKRKERAEAEKEAEEEPKDKIPQDLIDKAWNTRDLIFAIENLLRRFVIIRDPRIYLVIAVYVVATYIYDLFDYFAILWVTSAGKRSGKTKLLEVLNQLVSHSSGILINVTEGVLFRTTHRGTTLILDEIEKLRFEDHERYSHIMAILNSGFQKGGTVPRLRKDSDGNFSESSYSTYGPKIIAGIASVTDTIADRAIPIKMIRRVRSREPIERFRFRKLASELSSVVFQLKIWAAAKGASVGAIYDGLGPEPDELKTCDDRFLDIIEPLLAVALHADAEYANGDRRVTVALIDILRSIGTGRDAQEGDAPVAAIEIIKGILGEKQSVLIPSADLVRAFSLQEATAWIKNAQALARFLSKLELIPKRDPTRKFRGYEVTQTWVSDMIERYFAYTSDPQLSDPSETPTKSWS